MTITSSDETWEGLTGRVTESVPGLLDQIPGTHFHLVGNHDMIENYHEALRRARQQPKLARTSD